MLDIKAIREQHTLVPHSHFPADVYIGDGFFCSLCRQTWPCIVIQLCDELEKRAIMLAVLGEYLCAELTTSQVHHASSLASKDPRYIEAMDASSGNRKEWS